MSGEEELLPLSGIQHFAYCRRQWALIHIEQQWAENFQTADGRIIHERVHDADEHEKRGDLIISRGMPVVSHALGLNGVCDVVELHESEQGVTLTGQSGLWQPIPVEYKRGKPKEHDADELQLAAQAICLEEMLLCSIPHGFLYYNAPHRRLKVALNEPLRGRVHEMAAEMHQLYRRGYTPHVRHRESCKSCSLRELCLPALGKHSSAAAYIHAMLKEKGE